METEHELRKTLENTLSKYRTNKEKVSPEDLARRYKIAFDKLKEQLRGLTKDYLLQITIADFKILERDGDEVIKEFQRCIDEYDAGKKAGRAIFKNYSIQELEQVGAELKERLNQIWVAYFHKHTCLYITEPCLQDPPETPAIYNDLIDQFYDLEAERWETREKPKGEAILMFISDRKEGDSGSNSKAV